MKRQNFTGLSLIRVVEGGGGGGGEGVQNIPNLSLAGKGAYYPSENKFCTSHSIS